MASFEWLTGKDPKIICSRCNIACHSNITELKKTLCPSCQHETAPARKLPSWGDAYPYDN